jgi:hypothetical protein
LTPHGTVAHSAFRHCSLWINTMNRWIKPALLGLSCAAALAAAAQGFVREAPKDVKPGLMAVSATPPIIAIDGKEERLSPGARVRDTNNMMVLSGALAGKTLYTVYRRDPGGLVHEVWLLTPEEYAKVGGVTTGDPQGYKRFQDLLNLIWTARVLAGLK